MSLSEFLLKFSLEKKYTVVKKKIQTEFWLQYQFIYLH